MKYSKYSVVIVGSGISGLFLANKLSEHNNLKDGILLITKENLFSGSSALAQGGIVSVIPEINPKDSVESHIKDTMVAGCGLNNINTVKFVSQNSALAIQELMRFGVEFDKKDNKTLSFTLEGAHSCPRILHSKGDSTGRIIEETLCDRIEKSSNIEIYTNTIALELLTDLNNECKGLVLYNKENSTFETVYSSNVVLATGGIGQIYQTTTNPITSCGDGIALAYNSGAAVENMEFVQFHPTALYCENKTTMPLVSESARGEGAKLVDLEGNYFAKNYHYQADLAPRDVVARAIMEQIKEKNDKYVNLDISQIGIEKFKKRFPTITSLCLENNIDLSCGLIPVIPAEHYFMGGIKVDLTSQTSIKNLYAIGECSSTGLHGANRLASNSLLECAVFAMEAYKTIIKNNLEAPKKHDSKVKSIIEKYIDIDIDDDINTDEEIKKYFAQLKNCMTLNVGIARDVKSLSYALNTINSISAGLKTLNNLFNPNKLELKNALIVAKLITQAALNRRNSIGAHFRLDDENQNNNIERNISDDKILVK